MSLGKLLSTIISRKLNDHKDREKANWHKYKGLTQIETLDAFIAEVQKITLNSIQHHYKIPGPFPIPPNLDLHELPKDSVEARHFSIFEQWLESNDLTYNFHMMTTDLVLQTQTPFMSIVPTDPVWKNTTDAAEIPIS